MFFVLTSMHSVQNVTLSAQNVTLSAQNVTLSAQSDSFVQIQKLETRKIGKKTTKISKKIYVLIRYPVRSGPVNRIGSPDPVRFRKSRSGRLLVWTLDEAMVYWGCIFSCMFDWGLYFQLYV